MDILDEMLCKQRVFMERISRKHPEYGCMTKVERLKGLSNFLIDESLELKNELGYMYNDEKKWWKSNIDYDRVLEEFIDTFHIVLQMAIELDLSATDVFNLYCKGLDMNNKRQDNEY